MNRKRALEAAASFDGPQTDRFVGSDLKEKKGSWRAKNRRAKKDHGFISASLEWIAHLIFGNMIRNTRYLGSIEKVPGGREKWWEKLERVEAAEQFSRREVSKKPCSK